MNGFYKKQFYLFIIAAFICAVYLFSCNNHPTENNHTENKDSVAAQKMWQAPDSTSIPATAEGDLIRYGRELIAHTSIYLGPKGKVAHLSNGMNCQNCHLEAGTKTWGNNLSGVYSTYPKFKERCGCTENIYTKINDCFQRSLNGKPLDTASHEIKAIYAYIKWLGTGVTKGVKPEGAGIKELPFLHRAADTVKGKLVFEEKCVHCHASNGQGVQYADGLQYVYPPLWGEHSYNTGASLFRLTKSSGFIQANMPFDSTYEKQKLTDEQAWDVAAFISSQTRPAKNLEMDWRDISTKPVDYPFGPYTDGFTEQQHKYGPYADIKKAKRK